MQKYKIYRRRANGQSTVLQQAPKQNQPRDRRAADSVWCPRRGFGHFTNSLELNMFILVKMQNAPSWNTSLLLRFSIIHCLAAARTIYKGRDFYWFYSVLDR